MYVLMCLRLGFIFNPKSKHKGKGDIYQYQYNKINKQLQDLATYYEGQHFSCECRKKEKYRKRNIYIHHCCHSLCSYIDTWIYSCITKTETGTARSTRYVIFYTKNTFIQNLIVHERKSRNSSTNGTGPSRGSCLA